MPISQPQLRPQSQTQPITVDPSEVFNHYEYQRRKTAAAEIATANNRTKTISNHVNTQPAVTGPTSGQPPPNLKEQIETDIKVMIEKMREYKARNPTAFSEAWEQFKKVMILSQHNGILRIFLIRL